MMMETNAPKLDGMKLSAAATPQLFVQMERRVIPLLDAHRVMTKINALRILGIIFNTLAYTLRCIVDHNIINVTRMMELASQYAMMMETNAPKLAGMNLSKAATPQLFVQMERRVIPLLDAHRVMTKTVGSVLIIHTSVQELSGM
jgi:hypothetical protein